MHIFIYNFKRNQNTKLYRPYSNYILCIHMISFSLALHGFHWWFNSWLFQRLVSLWQQGLNFQKLKEKKSGKMNVSSGSILDPELRLQHWFTYFMN